jgi:hypothetical protein
MRRKLLISVAIVLLATPTITRAHKGNDENDGPIIPRLSSSPTFSVSTIPLNGDVNPYGVPRRAVGSHDS